MVTMTTIQPPSALLQFLAKNIVKITQFKMIPESTIFNLRILNFVK